MFKRALAKSLRDLLTRICASFPELHALLPHQRLQFFRLVAEFSDGFCSVVRCSFPFRVVPACFSALFVEFNEFIKEEFCLPIEVLCSVSPILGASIRETGSCCEDAARGFFQPSPEILKERFRFLFCPSPACERVSLICLDLVERELDALFVLLWRDRIFRRVSFWWRFFVCHGHNGLMMPLYSIVLSSFGVMLWMNGSKPSCDSL